MVGFLKPDPVVFTAACPDCGLSTEWVAQLDFNAKQTSYHIDCARCGPCPCPNTSQH